MDLILGDYETEVICEFCGNKFVGPNCVECGNKLGIDMSEAVLGNTEVLDDYMLSLRANKIEEKYGNLDEDVLVGVEAVQQKTNTIFYRTTGRKKNNDKPIQNEPIAIKTFPYNGESVKIFEEKIGKRNKRIQGLKIEIKGSIIDISDISYKKESRGGKNWLKRTKYQIKFNIKGDNINERNKNKFKEQLKMFLNEYIFYNTNS